MNFLKIVDIIFFSHFTSLFLEVLFHVLRVLPVFSYHWRNLKQILQLATTCIIKQKSNSFKWKKIFELKYLPDLEILLFLWRKQCFLAICDIKSVASSNNKAAVLSGKIFELKYFLPDLEYSFIYNSYEENNVSLLLWYQISHIIKQ